MKICFQWFKWFSLFRCVCSHSFTCVIQSCSGMWCVCCPSCFTAPLLTRSLLCPTLWFLSTPVHPGTSRRERWKPEKPEMQWHISSHSLNNMPSDNKSFCFFFFFLSSFKNDEEALANQKGDSADDHPTENRYKTNNFLIIVIAVLARKLMRANCHWAHFKVITK